MRCLMGLVRWRGDSMVFCVLAAAAACSTALVVMPLFTIIPSGMTTRTIRRKNKRRRKQRGDVVCDRTMFIESRVDVLNISNLGQPNIWVELFSSSHASPSASYISPLRRDTQGLEIWLCHKRPRTPSPPHFCVHRIY